MLRCGSAYSTRYEAASLMGLHTSAASLPSCSAIIFRTSTRTASVSCDCEITGIKRKFLGMTTSASHPKASSSGSASFHTCGACPEDCDQRRAPQQPVRSTDHPDDESMFCALYKLRRSEKWTAQRSAVVSHMLLFMASGGQACLQCYGSHLLLYRGSPGWKTPCKICKSGERTLRHSRAAGMQMQPGTSIRC